MEQRPKRVSVTVREGPKAESRGKNLHEAIQEVFSCCQAESSCQHRRSLAADSRRLSTPSWTRVSDIPSDMLPFAMESMVKGDDAMEDDINHHKLSEDMDDYQRAVVCLNSDRKTFAPANFDRFVRENVDRAMNEVWPILEKELRESVSFPESAEPFHAPASKKFAIAIVELYIRGNGAEARKILNTVFDLIPTESSEISTYWVDCLEKLVESCNSGDVQKDIFPTIVEKFASKHATVNAKIGACRLLRKLAGRFNHDVIQKKLFPIMDILARDVEPMVRYNAANSIPEMIHRMKNKDQALKLINVVSQDSEPFIRAAITSTIVQSITLMSPQDPRNKVYLESVMQTLKLLVKDAYIKRNIDLLVSYSECMGRVSHAFSLAGVLKPKDILWYLDAFLQLSKFEAKALDSGIDSIDDEQMPTGFANFRANMEFNRRQSILETLISTKPPAQIESRANIGQMNTTKAIAVLRANAESKRLSIPYGGIPPSVCLRFVGPERERAHECRMNAAKEFYDFILFAKPIVDFRYELHPLAMDLMHDSHPEVRAAMATKLLPIMESLGPEAALVHGELVYGLTDDDLDVIQSLVPSLAKILKCLVAANVLSPERLTPKLVEIGGAVLYCEERLNQTTFYTVHQIMLEQFSVLPFCLPGDYIYSNFVPALFHRLRHMRQIPCRMAAADAIVIFLRHCRRSVQRESIRKRIKEGFASGHSVHDRMLFLYMAKRIMEKFSRKYFRDHFIEDVLGLANDPVGNVRRKVIELMPELKGISDDPNLQHKLEQLFHKAKKSEIDRDVKAAIEETFTKFLNKKLQAGDAGGRKLSDSKSNNKPRDPDDEAKEQEEAYIAGLESNSVLMMGPDVPSKSKRKSFYGTTKQKLGE